MERVGLAKFIRLVTFNMSAALHPGTRLGRYEIKSQIGAGGMGEVYRARDPRLGRDVAIKVLPGVFSSDVEKLTRFRQEARAASTLSHPYVAHIYEIGEADGYSFISMEYVEGETLRQTYAREPLQLSAALQVVAQTAAALAAAHQAGIVHRDIKPENIMLRHDGYVKVLDFGLAKLSEQSGSSLDRDASVKSLVKTNPGMLLGTVAYMSPEQARGLTVDARTDIWSLGVVLYEALAGRLPFAGVTGSDVLASILTADPEESARTGTEVPNELWRVVRKALHKDAGQRYQAATEMRADLQRIERRLEFETEMQRSADVAPPEPPDLTRRPDYSTTPSDTPLTPQPPTTHSGQSQNYPLEIAHVLFMDVVGYSRLPMSQQTKTLHQLVESIRRNREFQRAEANDQLIRLPTGDGVALAFFGSPEAPVRCALEVSLALRGYPEMKVRMGVHSGPVYRVSDINTNQNLAGGGINIAQRVMDCGDAGHILISRTVADVLDQLSGWKEKLHDLGKAEVKHGVRVHLFNLYTDEVGNPAAPEKLRSVQDLGEENGVAPPADGVRAESSGAKSGSASLDSSQSSPLSGRRKSRKAIDSLAVLPFVNVNSDPNADYLSDGITESIINSLSQLPKLRVVSRNTVFRYKGQEVNPQVIGQELGVRAVFTGRVRQLNERLLISTELVDVSNDAQLWGEQYNRTFSDIFEVQEEISREISEKLRLKLSGEQKKKLTKRHTDSAAAYQTYLKGRYYWNKRTLEGLQRGVEYFQQAIALDPNYALAHAGLADSYALLGAVEYGALPPSEAMQKGRAAAVRALQLDDALAEAHASLGYIKIFYWDWQEAEKEYRRAIELNPNYSTAHHWYGHYLTAMGRFDEALVELQRAQELDPLSLAISAGMGWHFYLTRQNKRAIGEYRKTLEMDPNFYMARFLLGLAYEQEAMYEEALAEYQLAGQLSGGSLAMRAAPAHAYAMLGRRDEAERVLAEIQRLSNHSYVSPYHVASIYTALGSLEQAFDWLRRACDNRSEGLLWLAVDPILDSLRNDPQFTDIKRRVGLA